MNGHTNGHNNGIKLVNGDISAFDDQQAVKEVRKLVIDICRQNGGGHGGSGKLISTKSFA
jgi:dihydroxyacetone synthase